MGAVIVVEALVTGTASDPEDAPTTRGEEVEARWPSLSKRASVVHDMLFQQMQAVSSDSLMHPMPPMGPLHQNVSRARQTDLRNNPLGQFAQSLHPTHQGQ